MKLCKNLWVRIILWASYNVGHLTVTVVCNGRCFLFKTLKFSFRYRDRFKDVHVLISPCKNNQYRICSEKIARELTVTKSPMPQNGDWPVFVKRWVFLERQSRYNEYFSSFWMRLYIWYKVIYAINSEYVAYFRDRGSGLRANAVSPSSVMPVPWGRRPFYLGLGCQ